jgi:DNA-binding beta-propeller fold protein YncE
MRMLSHFLVWTTLMAAGSAAAQDPAPAPVMPSRVDVQPFGAVTFATLPADANFPEGIAADPATGSIFVDTLDLAPNGAATNFLLRYDLRGRLLAKLDFGTAPLTGLAFNRRDGKVYIARPGTLIGQDAKIQRVPGNFDATTAIEDVAIMPNIPAPAPRNGLSLDGQPVTTTFADSFALPNGLVFRDSDGALFVTDSLQAAVFSIADPSQATNLCPASSTCVTTAIQDPQLASPGFPALGVNGAAFAKDEARLFLTNTGDDRLLALDMTTGALTAFVEAIDGADGIVTGPGNTLLVSAPLSDEILAIDATTGRTVAELGEFLGIRRDGSVRGLLFPGSIVRVGNALYANNLALPQTNTPAEPEADVRTYTVARILLPPSLILPTLLQRTRR